MSLIGYIRDLDRKFAWSFLGVLLALLFGGITIQREFFADSGPHLRYDILTSTPVLDVHEDVSKLNVLFDGIDIRQQKKSLRVITVRVVNDSQKDILRGYYDEAEPLGLRVSTGRIIRCDLVTTSNPYLERQLIPQQRDDTTLVFSSVILESQEYFVLKLLVLHDESKQPEITPVGKVAGIRIIPVAEAFKQEASRPFLHRTFAGSLPVQVVRVFAYPWAMIGLAIGIILPIAYVGDKLGKRKRREIAEQFKKTTSFRLRADDQFLFDTYVGDGSTVLLPMLSMVSDPRILEVAYGHYEEYKKRREYPLYLGTNRGVHERYHLEDMYLHFRRMHDCVRSGLIKKTQDGPVADEHMKAALEEFVAFLKKKQLVPAAEPSRSDSVSEVVGGKEDVRISGDSVPNSPPR